MDRFKNTYENEYCYCEGCARKLHYSLLNDQGYCQNCADEIKEREQFEKETKQDADRRT